MNQGDVHLAKPRSNKKAEAPKEMILCVLCGVILAGGGLMASIVFTVRKYQGSVSGFVWDVAWLAALLMVPAAILLVVLYIRAYRHRKMTHAIEANLVDIINVQMILKR